MKNFFSIKDLQNLPTDTGVYLMLSAKQEILYVGKAINLKKRITSYFKKDNKPQRIISLVSHIVSIKIIITKTEKQALILESRLIKTYLPKYNVVFRDDKTYIYIALDYSNNYPRILSYRGKESKTIKCFGPYTKTTHVKQVIKIIQTFYKIRTCSDGIFNTHKACMLYDINMCSAPCINKINKKDYETMLNKTIKLLNNKSDELIKRIKLEIKEALKNSNYVKANNLMNDLECLQTIFN